MRKYPFLLAVGCLLSIYSCQKETVAPLPESNKITTTAPDDSPYFSINTLEDLATLEELFAQEDIATSRSSGHTKVVHVPSGSKNAIQAAITEAGPLGVVVLNKGNHYEEQTIVINQPVFIKGQPGATIIASGQSFNELGGFRLDPLFTISQTKRVTIWGVAMQGKENGSSSAIEIISTTNTVLANNTIDNFQGSIIVNKGNKTLIWKNKIAGVTGDLGNSPTGIGIVNGTAVTIIQNKVSGCIWGILCGGQGGLIQSNELSGNQTGLNLDFFVPLLVTSNGNLIASDFPATNWIVQNNYAHDNINAGYVLSAGANNNKIINNRGGNNTLGDVILASDGFNAVGFPSPASFDNFVDTGNNKDFTTMDCGNNNQVKDGTILPCTIF